MSQYERYICLEKQLSNEPLILIKSLQGVNKRFEEEKELLLKAFSSPTLRKFVIIKRLTALKLANSSDTYSCIEEMRSVLSIVRTMKVDIEDILQFFVWRSLPEEFKTQFVHIINDNLPLSE